MRGVTVRRVTQLAAWTVLLIGLAAVAGYVTLQVSGGTSPPLVPVSTGNQLPGLTAGDAVLLRSVSAGDVEEGTVVAARIAGAIVLGRVAEADVIGSTVGYEITGTGRDEAVSLTHRELVGAADRTLPFVGWPLLALRQTIVQLALGVASLILVALLATGRRTPLAQLDDDAGPDEDSDHDDAQPAIEARAAQLALPAGPAALPAAPQMTYRLPPMGMTPDDLRQVRFAQTRRGYDTQAVDQALDLVADGLEALLRERDELLERVRGLEAEVERYKGMEASLTETLTIAERGAEQVKADARAEAERILADARRAAPSAAARPQQGDTMAELLGETRAIRSLLQAVLAQGGVPRPGQDT